MGVFNGDSIYNGDALYKGNSISNSLYNENALKETLFLSKFDNYNDSLQQDIPDIGYPYIFDPTKQSVKHSVEFLFSKYINGIDNTYIQNDYVGFEKDIETKFLSSEAWIRISGTRYDFGVRFWIGPDFILADPNFSSTEWGMFGPWMGADYIDSYTMFNGTANAQYNYVKFGVAPRDMWFFYSNVYDVDAKEIRYYMNGDIMLIVKLKNDYEKWAFKIKQAESGKNTRIVYTGVFGYDKSENGGTSYPITTL